MKRTLPQMASANRQASSRCNILSLRLLPLAVTCMLTGSYLIGSTAQAQFCFDPPVNYPTAIGSTSVFAADLDGDGDADLAVANALSNNVSVLMNNGNGTYSSVVNYTTGTLPRSVFAADLDGVGGPDLAVTNFGSDSVSVMMNNGNGTFASAVKYGTGSGPESVVASDLDGDSDQDLAVVNTNSNNVSVLKNNGNGTFGLAVNYVVGGAPSSVFAADLDGDGDQDLAVANNSSGTVSVLTNDGTGAYGSAVNYATGSGSRSVFAAGLDLDGDQDIVVANANSATVSVLMNNGNGTYSSAVNYTAGSQPLSVFAADLGGDGDPDLAVASGSDVSLLANNGNGTYALQVTYVAGYVPSSVFAADLDGDGDQDLAVANYGGTVSVLINCSPLAQFETCYGSTGSAEPNNPGALITINPLTGAGTLVGPTGIIGANGPSVPVLAIKSTGEIYALSATINSDLYKISSTTGAATFIANTGLSLPDALAFDANDVLYAISNSFILSSVDVTTGVPTIVGSTAFVVKALAYDPTDGTMYASSVLDEIYTIDLTNASTTLVGVTGLGGSTAALRFDQNGNLFGTKGSSANPYTLVSINKSNGQGTTIGPIGFEAVLGMASRVLYTPTSPCDDFTTFLTRCTGTGVVQARVVLRDNIEHSGEEVLFSIDGAVYPATIGDNGVSSRASISVSGLGAGDHAVSLIDPPDCFEPTVVTCLVTKESANREWEADDAEWAMETRRTTPVAATKLLGNYPNPFNPKTEIRFQISEYGWVKLTVFDLLGREVATLVDGFTEPGYHQVTLDASALASGLYIYRLTTGSFSDVKKLLVLK